MNISDYLHLAAECFSELCQCTQPHHLDQSKEAARFHTERVLHGICIALQLTTFCNFCCYQLGFYSVLEWVLGKCNLNWGTHVAGLQQAGAG
jgi:hypothetical protein